MSEHSRSGESRYRDPRSVGHQRWTLKATEDHRWIVWNVPPVMDADVGRVLELQPGTEARFRPLARLRQLIGRGRA